ncbi:MAG: SRPBCC family protein [Dehalococcoidia bacterium]|nr:SRPBCC family protein [Dehalococcoidia bacterium]
MSVSRIMPAPQARIWSVLADIANARRWNTSWTRIEITSHQTHGAGTAFRAHTQDGQTYDFLVSDWAAPECIAFSPIRDESEPRYGVTLESHAFRLRPAEDGQTYVELTAHATARGIRGRLVGLFLWPGHQKHGLETALDALESVFAAEADDGGSAAVSEGSPPGG